MCCNRALSASGPLIDVDTLLHCRWVIPVIPRGLVLEDHAVAIESGRIVAILPSQEATGRYRAPETVHLPHHAVTPGLVNAHTHAAMTLLRGVGDDLPLMRWLTERIWPLEKALVSPEFVYDGGRLAALEMLRSGTTCASDMYFYPEASVRAFRWWPGSSPSSSRRLTPRTPRTIFGRDWPPATACVTIPWSASRWPRTRRTPSAMPRCSGSRCSPTNSICRSTPTCTKPSTKCAGPSPSTAVGRSPGWTAWDSCAHCPASNLKLGSGIAPIADVLASGVNLAIGTDGAASNNRLDMLSELRLAALLAKGAAEDASVLPAAAVLEAATRGGAQALGLRSRIGSIEAGKEADLAAFDLNLPETQPLYDVISHLVYSAGREQVSDVWVAGHRVVQGRQLVDSYAQPDLLPNVAAWQNSGRRVLLTPRAS